MKYLKINKTWNDEINFDRNRFLLESMQMSVFIITISPRRSQISFSLTNDNKELKVNGLL